MLQHISTIEDLEKEAEEIDSFLNTTYSEEIAEMTERLINLGVKLARTGKMFADSRFHQDKATTNSILNNVDTGLTSLNLKKLIESTCYRENYIVNWIERLNKTIVHQIDSIRTLISLAKEDLKYNLFNNQT